MLILLLLSFISLSLNGRKLGEISSIWVSNVLTVISLLWLIITLYSTNSQLEWNENILWLSILKLDISLTYDKYSLILSISILLVSASVNMYSVNYIKFDKSKIWFISLLNIFTLSILLLTLSNNLLQLFIGWELIGITSYLLIGFWSNRNNANSASIKAFIMNRIGDIILIYLISLLYADMNDISYNNMYNLLEWTTILLLLSSIVKSSQLGLHSWLPTSIEGPTPVSALIHAATLVTAGVFLIVKLSSILVFTKYIGLVGSLTVLSAGLIGSFQSDIKRLIAYSTISQIGYIYVSIGVINYSIAISHIINHAVFKALLFLCAGTVIHSILNQDIRKYGGLLNNMKLSYVLMLFGSISLIALPTLTGYYSKDIIITLAYGSYNYYGTLMYLSSLFGAILTGYYSIRLIKLTYLTVNNNNTNNHLEISYLDLLSKISLFVISLVLGYLSGDWSININIDNEYMLTWLEKSLPLIITLLGSLAQYYLPLNLSIIINQIWFDNMWSKLSIWILYNNKLLMNKFDRGLLEILGPNGINMLLNNINLSILISKTVIYYGWLKLLTTLILLLVIYFKITLLLEIFILLLMISY